MTTFFGSLAFLPQALADPAMLRWIGALVLLVVMLVLLREFVRTVREDPPSVDTHWGGIGGGLGGWRISPSLAYLIAIIAFGAMFTTVLPAADKKDADRQDEKQDAEKAKAPEKGKAPEKKEPGRADPARG